MSSRRSTRSQSRSTAASLTSESEFEDVDIEEAINASTSGSGVRQQQQQLDQNTKIATRRKGTGAAAAEIAENRKKKRTVDKEQASASTSVAVPAKGRKAVARKGGAKKLVSPIETISSNDGEEDEDMTVYANDIVEAGLGVSMENERDDTAMEDEDRESTPRAGPSRTQKETISMEDLAEEAERGLEMLFAKRELGLSHNEKQLLEQFRQKLVRQAGVTLDQADSQDSQFSSLMSFPENSHPNSRPSQLVNLFTMLSALFVGREETDALQILETLRMLDQGFLSLLAVNGKEVDEQFLESWVATKRQVVIHSKKCGEMVDVQAVFAVHEALEERLLAAGQGILLRWFEESLTTALNEFSARNGNMDEIIQAHPFDTLLGMILEQAGPAYRSLLSNDRTSPTGSRSGSSIRQVVLAASSVASASRSSNKRASTSKRSSIALAELPGLSDSEASAAENDNELNRSMQKRIASKRGKSLGGAASTPVVPKVQNMREKLQKLQHGPGSGSPRRRGRQSMPMLNFGSSPAQRRLLVHNDDEEEAQEGDSTMEVEQMLLSTSGGRAEQDGPSGVEDSDDGDAASDAGSVEPGIEDELAGYGQAAYGQDQVSEISGSDNEVQNEGQDEREHQGNEDHGENAIENEDEYNDAAGPPSDSENGGDAPSGSIEGHTTVSETDEDDDEDDEDDERTMVARPERSESVLTQASSHGGESETQLESIPIDQALLNPEIMNAVAAEYRRREQSKQEKRDSSDEEGVIVVASRNSKRATSSASTTVHVPEAQQEPAARLRFDNQNRIKRAEAGPSKKGAYASMLERQADAKRIGMDSSPNSQQWTARIPSQSLRGDDEDDDQEPAATPGPSASSSSRKVARKSSAKKAPVAAAPVPVAPLGMSEKAKGKRRAVSDDGRTARKTSRPAPSPSPPPASDSASATAPVASTSHSRRSPSVHGGAPPASLPEAQADQYDNSWQDHNMLEDGYNYQHPEDEEEPQSQQAVLQHARPPSATHENGETSRSNARRDATVRQEKRKRPVGDDELAEGAAGPSRPASGTNKPVKKRQPPSSFMTGRKSFVDEDSEADEAAPPARHTAPAATVARKSKPVSKQNQRSRDPERAAPRNSDPRPAASAPQRMERDSTRRRRVEKASVIAEDVLEEESEEDKAHFSNDDEDDQGENNDSAPDARQGNAQASTSRRPQGRVEKTSSRSKARPAPARGNDEDDDDEPANPFTAGSELHKKRSGGKKRKKTPPGSDDGDNVGDDSDDGDDDNDDDITNERRRHNSISARDRRRYLEHRNGVTNTPQRKGADRVHQRAKTPYYYPQGHDYLHWTKEEDICLLDCLDQHPNIGDRALEKLHGRSGTESRDLKRRNNVSIKDRKRDIAMYRRRNGLQDFEWYESWIWNARGNRLIKGKRRAPVAQRGGGDDDSEEDSSD